MRERAAVWLRVSDADQTVENQVAPLYEAADRRNLDVVEVYKLEGLSAWKNQHRRELSRLYADAAAGRFSIVLVAALDRLSRSGARDTLEVIDRLGAVGVRLVSLREPWTEAEGPYRELLLAIAGWWAKQESGVKSERTRAGIARHRAAGGAHGRPPATQYVDIDRVALARADGKGWRTIQAEHPRTVPTRARGLKRPSVGTIRRAWDVAAMGVPKTGPPTEGVAAI